MAPNPHSKVSYSITSLKRWSCKQKEKIPGIPDIKALHVYDFDNTVFSSPLPNPQIWQQPTPGHLQGLEVFAHGSWWHDPSVLEATGDGVEKEEPRGWAGCWNESVVDLVKLSLAQKDVLTVLLTGRAEAAFSEIVNRIANSRNLDFDLVALKPEVAPNGDRLASTMDFKQAFLRDLVFTYKNADEIRVYEDRQKHVKGFREYFERLNKSLLSHPMDQPPPPRKPITAEVIHVCELAATLDSQTEITVVQRMINRHNHAIMNHGPNPYHAANKLKFIRENFIYCGYLINQNDSSRLISLTNCAPHLIDSGEVKYLASSILISPHPASPQLLAQVGGKGNKVTWQVTGIARFEDRIWAARVAPVPETERPYTKDSTPLVVLALRKGTRPIDAARIQHWNPVPPEKQLVFETVVGDKVMLRLEEEDFRDGGFGASQGAYGQKARNGRFDGGHGGTKRKFGNGSGVQDDDWKGKENMRGGAFSNGNTERDDGSWVPKSQQQNSASDRHGQARYFNQGKQPNADGRNFSGGGRGSRQSGGNGGRKNNNNTNNQDGAGRQRGSNEGARGGGVAGGGGGRNRAGNRAPAYKSLDDYGPAGFDGSVDSKAPGGGGLMDLNY